MDNAQQIKILERIKDDASELLEVSKAEVTTQPKPCLKLTFTKDKSPWLEKEDEISVFVDINSISSMGYDLPHISFTAYFPYPIAKLDDIHMKFLLKTLNDLFRGMPFIELGSLQKQGQTALSVRCNRLLAASDIEPPEVVFFVNQVIIAIEYTVVEYEEHLKRNGVSIT